jgi:outer membrane protein OmpA-like peptidoglycan-associated protein
MATKAKNSPSAHRHAIILALIATAGSVLVAAVTILPSILNHEKSKPPQLLPPAHQSEKTADSSSLLQEQLRPIYFQGRSLSLSDDARAALSRYAVLLTKAQRKIIIEGHSDKIKPESNIQLGLERARIVKRYLIELGVSPDAMEVVSFGGELSLTETQSDYNHRVTFKLIPDS